MMICSRKLLQQCHFYLLTCSSLCCLHRHHHLRGKNDPPCLSASYPCTAAKQPETVSADSRVERQNARPSGHPHCFRREYMQPPPTTSHSMDQLNTSSCSVTPCRTQASLSCNPFNIFQVPSLHSPLLHCRTLPIYFQLPRHRRYVHPRAGI